MGQVMLQLLHWGSAMADCIIVNYLISWRVHAVHLVVYYTYIALYREIVLTNSLIRGAYGGIAFWRIA